MPNFSVLIGSKIFQPVTFLLLGVLGWGLLIVAPAGAETGSLEVARVVPDRGAIGDIRSSRFESIEEAAVAALTATRGAAGRIGDQHLYVGTILRLPDGSYGWRGPNHSGEALNASWRPRVRITLGSDHVATFIVVPRTGDRKTDRASEVVSARERHFVDEVDALHRPVYLLTPSNRVLRYGEEEPAVADRRRRAATVALAPFGIDVERSGAERE